MANTLDIFYNLKEAYECSTHNNNLFEKTLKSIKWDSQFYADNEYYFIKGDLTLTTTSLNPFKVDWTPEALFTDGSLLTF